MNERIGTLEGGNSPPKGFRARCKMCGQFFHHSGWIRTMLMEGTPYFVSLEDYLCNNCQNKSRK